MANVFKKVELGEMLSNLGLPKLQEAYNNANTDESILNAYHYILNSVEGSELAEIVVNNMISYSYGKDLKMMVFLIKREVVDSGTYVIKNYKSYDENRPRT